MFKILKQKCLQEVHHENVSFGTYCLNQRITKTNCCHLSKKHLKFVETGLKLVKTDLNFIRLDFIFLQMAPMDLRKRL